MIESTRLDSLATLAIQLLLQNVMEFKRILVALNSPNGRDAAFERALALAKSSGAELYLLYAVPVNELFSFRAAERLERMADMRTRAEDAGVRVKTVEQHGDAAEIIELHANAREVGPHRHGWRGTAWLGPPLVGRGKGDSPDKGSDLGCPEWRFGQFDRLRKRARRGGPVTGFGGRPQGCSWTDGAQPVQLTVMHTVQGLEAADAVQSPARWKVPEFRAHVLDDARRTLEGLVSDVAAGMDTRVEVSAGSASRAILEHAADVDADLVVMGRSRGFKLLGSTALRILRKNDRALLVIPSTAHRTGQVERQHAA